MVSENEALENWGNSAGLGFSTQTGLRMKVFSFVPRSAGSA